MKIKKLITLIESLALTGLVSVGFSSWLIIETNPAVIAGRVNVEEVFDNNDYILIKNMTFSDYYFIDGDGGFYPDYTYTSNLAELTDTGILEFDIVIDIEKYKKELITSPSNVELDIYLGYSELHDGEAIGNFLDVISRSLSKTSVNIPGSFNSTYACYYDSVNTTDFSVFEYDPVAYSETTVPVVDRIITLKNIDSVNKIIVSATYTFELDGGFTANDNASLDQGGVPFKIHATLNNA